MNKPKKIIICCFYWNGSRWNADSSSPDAIPKLIARVGETDNKMAARYVNNLYKSTRKWAGSPFEFICFTNEKLPVLPGVQIRKFEQVTKKLQLARFYMFSKKARMFGSQVVCMDLDVVITGPLYDLLMYRGLYCVRNRWIPGQEKQGAGDIVSFQAGPETEKIFWTPLIKDVDKAVELTNGGYEPDWIDLTIGKNPETWDDILPERQIFSYKHHVKAKNFPENARIISCHGYPRPHQINEEWRLKNWK